MVHFDNLKTHATDFPETWTFLWSPEEAADIPQTHKDQIFFLDAAATTFVQQYIASAKMVTGPLWKPFNERYFKTIETFEITTDTQQHVKKWLYEKPIPFDHFVLVDADRSGQAVLLTWKMVLHYWEGLFFADDLLIFDASLTWGLFYFHEDQLYFGSNKIYDKEFEYEKTKALQELKKQFFTPSNLNFTQEEKRKAIQAFKTKYDMDSLND